MQYITLLKEEIGCIWTMYSTRLPFCPGLRTLISGFGVTWMEDDNTKFSEWSILDKVRPSSINKWCRHYNHNSGHKILELPAPNNNKITIQDFIKYLLDTWKTKPFIEDHGSDRAQWLTPACSLSSSQMLSSLASSGPLPSLNRQGAREDAAVSSHLIQIRTANHGSFTKLRPGLGSYERCSFVCSSLQLRKKRTAKLGLQVRNISPSEK